MTYGWFLILVILVGYFGYWITYPYRVERYLKEHHPPIIRDEEWGGYTFGYQLTNGNWVIRVKGRTNPVPYNRETATPQPLKIKYTVNLKPTLS